MFLRFLVDHPKEFLYLLIYFILGAGITFYIVKPTLINVVNENWHYLSKQVWFLPFSGFFRPDSKNGSLGSSLNYIIKFVQVQVKEIFNIFTSPITYLFKMLGRIFSLVGLIIQKFRMAIKMVRNFLMDLMMQLMNKLQASISAVLYLILKLRNGLKRQLGFFKLLLNTAGHFNVYMNSLVNGPLQKVGQFGDRYMKLLLYVTAGKTGLYAWHDTACFKPDTLIKLNTGNEKMIKDCVIGDITENNEVLIGLVKVNINKPIEIYNYNGVYVSGSHLVNEDNVWKRIEDTNNAKLDSIEPCELICPMTSTHSITINNTEFSDWDETSELLNNYFTSVFNYLNNGKAQYNIENNGGFVINSKHDINNIITKISKQNLISGTCVRLSNNSIYRNKISGLVVDECTIIYDTKDNIWKPAYESDDYEYLDRPLSHLILHVITNTGIIKYKNEIIRDFMDIHDGKFLKETQNGMINYLNNNILSY